MLLSLKKHFRAWVKRPRAILPALTEHGPYLLRIGVWKTKRFLLGRFVKPRPIGPETRVCPRPFQWLEAKNDGSAHLCCSAWLPLSIGNLHKQSPAEVWDSKLAQQIRESVLDGSYVFCSAKRCPVLKANEVPQAGWITDPRFQEILRNRDVHVSEGAKTINASYDRTCNLSCPSCRSEPLTANEADRTRAEAIQNRLLSWNPNGLHTLYVTGSGDPFASPLFRKLLQSLDPSHYPNLKLRLHTNGLLLTPELWRTMARIHPLIEEMEISIDAATDLTYRTLRRGGELALLRQRLQFIQQVRTEGHIRKLVFSFVVQEANFTEMPEFVAFGERYGADRVYFSGLLNWGTFSPAEYLDKAVHQPHHPRHQEFLSVLSHPNLARPNVSLGNL